MDTRAKRLLLLYAVLAVPFFLNDFANIYIKDFATWIAVDYTFVKALPLAVMFWAVSRGLVGWKEFGLRGLPPLLFIYYGLAMSVLGVLMDQYGYDFFVLFLPSESLGAIPETPQGNWLGWFDLHVGLFMVGVMEELVFRGLAFTALFSAGLNSFWTIMLSALVFGLIHWSLGPAAVAATGAIGVLFGVCLWRTGSVLPLILAHFVVDYVFFS